MKNQTRNHKTWRSPVRFGVRIFAILVLFAGFGSAPADAEELIGPVLTRLQERYEGIKELEADFTQTTEFRGFSKTLTSTGKVFLKKERLRWDYLKPSQQQIFVEGDQVLFYVPEHQQVIKTRLSVELDSQVPVRLLAGSSHLQRDFDARWTDPEIPRETQGPYRLTLTPKTPGSGFTEFEIEVDPKDSLIRKIVLAEPGGNRSTFEFSNIKLNRGLKDRVFQFDVPKGVAVIEQP